MLKSKLSLYLSPKYNAFALLASRKTINHISRRKKENTRKARNRRKKKDDSAVLSLMLKLVDEFTFKALCFPYGYSTTTNSEFAVCDEKLNVDGLESFTNSSNVKKLKLLMPHQSRLFCS